MYDFKIIDDKGNQIFDYVSILKLINMHKREEEIYIYIDANDVVALITMRMPRCFTYKVEGTKRIEVKYFNDDVVLIKLYNNLIWYFNIGSLSYSVSLQTNIKWNYEEKTYFRVF